MFENEYNLTLLSSLDKYNKYLNSALFCELLNNFLNFLNNAFRIYKYDGVAF